MKIPVWLLTVVTTGALGLQAWTLNEVVKQGADIAAIKATINLRSQETASVK